jgi:hypothetical protein
MHFWYEVKKRVLIDVRGMFDEEEAKEEAFYYQRL